MSNRKKPANAGFFIVLLVGYANTAKIEAVMLSTLPVPLTLR
jgi:hypothetical protein